jgi:hypothetical protein
MIEIDADEPIIRREHETNAGKLSTRARVLNHARYFGKVRPVAGVGRACPAPIRAIRYLADTSISGLSSPHYPLIENL